MTYTTEALIETELGGATIDTTSVPTSSQLTTIITEEEQYLSDNYNTGDVNSNTLQKVATLLCVRRVLQIKAAADGIGINLEEGQWASVYKRVNEDIARLESKFPLKTDTFGFEIRHADGLED